jgi:hypothetical protein
MTFKVFLEVIVFFVGNLDFFFPGFSSKLVMLSDEVLKLGIFIMMVVVLAQGHSGEFIESDSSDE